MNALPFADSQDWLDRQAHTSRSGGEADDNSDPSQRLLAADHSFLTLRLEAALGRLAAMEALIEAERLHLRQARMALAASERALDNNVTRHFDPKARGRPPQKRSAG